MKAGLLKHTGVIQTVTLGDDVSTTDSWATLATVYCSLRPVSGREQELASKMQATTSHVIEWRYDATSATTTPRNRIVVDSTRTFNIDSVYNVDERNRWMRAYVTERVD